MRRTKCAAMERPNQDSWRILGDLAAGLTHQRTEILLHLARGDICVNRLAAELDLSRNDVSYHLRPLRDFGLVVFKRRGRDLVYGIGPNLRVMRRGLDVVLKLGVPGVCRMLIRVADGGRFDLRPREGDKRESGMEVTQRAGVSAPPVRAH